MTDYSNIVLMGSDTIPVKKLVVASRGVNDNSVVMASWNYEKKQIRLYGVETIKFTPIDRDIIDVIINNIVHECIHGVIDDITKHSINANSYDVHFPFACGITNDMEDVDLGYYWNHWEYYNRFKIMEVFNK